jgi:multiple sugar transport system permease protein
LSSLPGLPGSERRVAPDAGTPISDAAWVAPGRVVDRPRAERLRAWLDRERPFQYQLIMLPLLAMLVFQVVPIVHGIVISLTNFTIWSPEGSFAGLRNYVRVVTNPLFYRYALPNTFLFLALAVGLEVVLGLAIALLIDRRFPGQRLVRTLLVLPLLVAPVVAGLMFYWMFHSEFGLVNQVLHSVGLPGVLWFNRPWTAFGVVVLADVWTWTPWFILIIYAGLQSLPPEPFEAARIDGASAWNTFRLITVPLLYPVLSIIVLIRSFDAFRVFDVVWTMTGGGPGNATETFGTFVYRIGYLTVNYSEGAAAAMVGALLIMVVGVLVYGTFARVVWGRQAT